jgi:mono/diheme cytochrome c family protein
MKTLNVLALLLGPLVTTAAAAGQPGQDVFERRCQSCHGADGRGVATKAKSLGIDAALLSLGRKDVPQARDAMRAIVADGKDDMPAFGRKLKPAELDAVLDYTRQLANAIRASP